MTEVKIELRCGPGKYPHTRLQVYQEDIDKNIAAIDRAIDGMTTAKDVVLLNDTKSILEGIKRQLPTMKGQKEPPR